MTADDGGKYEICVENVQGNDTHTTSLAVEGWYRYHFSIRRNDIKNITLQDHQMLQKGNRMESPEIDVPLLLGKALHMTVEAL